MTKERRTNRQFLEDIIDAIENVSDFVAGKSEEEFFESYLLQSAVIRQFEIIGEAASKLTSDVIKISEGIDWKDVIGMRHRMIHNYFEVSVSVVWDTVWNDLPTLKKQIKKTLKDYK